MEVADLKQKVLKVLGAKAKEGFTKRALLQKRNS